MNVTTVPVSELVPYDGNAKLHSATQIDQIAQSIEEFGNCDPIAVWRNGDGELEVVEGHGRLMALKKLGIKEAPVVELDHLTDEQRRAYALVHNQTTLNSGFDFPMLSAELASIDGYDWDDFGFDSIAFAVGLSAEDDFDMNEFEDEMEPDASIVKFICRNDTEKERLRELIGETGQLKRMYRVSEL